MALKYTDEESALLAHLWTESTTWINIPPWTAPQHSGWPNNVGGRWLLITKHWALYSLKEASFSTLRLTCQSQNEYLIKATIGNDKDAVYTSSDRTGQALAPSHKSPQPWWLKRMESGPGEVGGQQLCLVCLKPRLNRVPALWNLTPPCVWTVPDNRDVESDKSKRGVLVLGLWRASGWHISPSSPKSQKYKHVPSFVPTGNCGRGSFCNYCEVT